MSSSTTYRARLHDLLRERALSALQLSQLVGISEREVTGHLEHLERSLRHGNEQLVVTAARCLSCAFVFDKRQRFSKPGSCPSCRHPRITRPILAIHPRQR